MANTRPPVISPQEIDRLRQKIDPDTGDFYTQAKIADMVNTTRQNISYIKHSVSSSMKTPREMTKESYPWDVGSKFARCAPNYRIRDHLEYLVTTGDGMSEDKLRRLWHFYKRLEDNDEVVEFDPSIPPTPGVSKVGGFAYRPRKNSDGDLIIRINEHTKVTEDTPNLFRQLDREEWPVLR